MSLPGPHGPDVGGGDGGHAGQLGEAGTSVGARDNRPASAVPVLDERVPRAETGAIAESDRPRIPRGDDVHVVEDVGVGAEVLAGYDPPRRAVPVQDQGSLAAVQGD